MENPKQSGQRIVAESRCSVYNDSVVKVEALTCSRGNILLLLLSSWSVSTWLLESMATLCSKREQWSTRLMSKSQKPKWLNCCTIVGLFSIVDRLLSALSLSNLVRPISLIVLPTRHEYSRNSGQPDQSLHSHQRDRVDIHTGKKRSQEKTYVVRIGSIVALGRVRSVMSCSCQHGQKRSSSTIHRMFQSHRESIPSHNRVLHQMCFGQEIHKGHDSREGQLLSDDGTLHILGLHFRRVHPVSAVQQHDELNFVYMQIKRMGQTSKPSLTDKSV